MSSNDFSMRSIELQGLSHEEVHAYTFLLARARIASARRGARGHQAVRRQTERRGGRAVYHPQRTEISRTRE